MENTKKSTTNLLNVDCNTKGVEKEVQNSNLVLVTGILSLFGPIVGGIMFFISYFLTEIKWLFVIVQAVGILLVFCAILGGWGWYFANEALAKYNEEPNLYKGKSKLIIGKVFSVISMIILALGFVIFVVNGAVQDFSKL